MRLTRQTTHAIRLLMYCAVNTDRLSRVGEVAAAYSVSDSFCSKILQPLVEAGFVETVRGRNGGIASPARLRRSRCARSWKRRRRVSRSPSASEPGGSDCPLIDNCNLNATLRRALDAFLSVLEGTTIAELAGEKSCDAPAARLPEIGSAGSCGQLRRSEAIVLAASSSGAAAMS